MLNDFGYVPVHSNAHESMNRRLKRLATCSVHHSVLSRRRGVAKEWPRMINRLHEICRLVSDTILLAIQERDVRARNVNRGSVLRRSKAQMVTLPTDDDFHKFVVECSRKVAVGESGRCPCLVAYLTWGRCTHTQVEEDGVDASHLIPSNDSQRRKRRAAKRQRVDEDEMWVEL